MEFLKALLCESKSLQTTKHKFVCFPSQVEMDTSMITLRGESCEMRNSTKLVQEQARSGDG